MNALSEEQRVGIEYLESVTTLLQRVRGAHPIKGLYEAADVQWWWNNARTTDDLGQLFWFDEAGRPEAAIVVIDWGDEAAVVPICMPDATPDWVAHVIDRGLAHAGGLGFETVDLEVDQADSIVNEALQNRGFSAAGGSGDPTASLSVTEAWLDLSARPEPGILADGYRLVTRNETMEYPSQINHQGPARQERLLQTSLYRRDLDLVVLDDADKGASYGLFWHDPETATGLVEPMRTEEHQRQRGLGRLVLTTGLNLLADAGAERVKICFEPDNDPAKALYLSVGFEPVKQTVVFSGSTGGRA